MMIVFIMISWICIIPCFGDNYLKGCWTLQSERSSVYSPNEGLGIICNDCPQIFFGDNGKGYYCFGDDGFTFSWEYCQGFLTISSEKSFLGNTGCQKFHVSISKTNINQKMILYRYHKENEKMDIFSLTNDELVISISKKINDRIDTDREMELAILKQLVPQDTYLSESDTIYILKGSVDNRSLFVESDSITHFMYERTIIHKVPESILNETHRFFVFSTLKRLVWEIVSSFNECSNQTFYRINQERSLNDLRIGF